jgi:quinol monooxygenase YgiN
MSGYLRWPLAVTTKENDMYARRISLKLRPNSATEFTKQLEKQVIPMLQKQKGFKDEISFVAQSGDDAFAVSLWDKKESADVYNREHYAEVSKIMEKLVVGIPRVDTYEVSNSTFHKISAAATA